MTTIFLAITVVALLAVFGIDAARKRREYLLHTTIKPHPEFRFFPEARDNRVMKFMQETANHGIR